MISRQGTIFLWFQINNFFQQEAVIDSIEAFAKVSVYEWYQYFAQIQRRRKSFGGKCLAAERASNLFWSQTGMGEGILWNARRFD